MAMVSFNTLSNSDDMIVIISFDIIMMIIIIRSIMFVKLTALLSRVL